MLICNRQKLCIWKETTWILTVAVLCSQTPTIVIDDRLSYSRHISFLSNKINLRLSVLYRTSRNAALRAAFSASSCGKLFWAFGHHYQVLS